MYEKHKVVTPEAIKGKNERSGGMKFPPQRGEEPGKESGVPGDRGV